MPPIIRSLAEVSGRYDVLFVDLWGCLHNGVAVYPAAVAALQDYRRGGGTVILVTNSPRPRPAVVTQIDGLGAPRDCWDDIASSGDAAQAAMAAGHFGRRVYHLGPDRDLSFFHDEAGQRMDIERVPLDDAEGIVCTGLFNDEVETAEDYRLTLMRAKQRDLKLLCANPDVIVDRGDRRVYCAGALAELYTDLGGQSFYFGKPHSPIYALARQRAEALRGGPVPDAAVLAIGDGIRTDIQGGLGEDLDTLFVAGGLAAADTGMQDGHPDAGKLKAFLDAARLHPTMTIGLLR